MAETSLWPAAIGLVGVVVGAGLTTWKEWWYQARREQKDREFLVIHVADSLERFAAGCLDVAKDNGTFMGQPAKDGVDYEAVVERPTFEPQALKVEWRVLDAPLMFKIIDLRRSAEIADRTIDFLSYYDDQPMDDFFETRQREYARLGQIAWGLAQQLRRSVGLPTRASSDWTPVEELETVLKRIAERRALVEARRTADLATMTFPPFPSP